jgi:hypothetical protein
VPALYAQGVHGITDWRRRSLLRGSTFVVVSLLAAFQLSHFPQNHPSPWIAIPLLGAIIGTADTVRCMQVRWSWYHGGVILCAYMDLMAIAIILFFLVYPLWL